MTLLTTPPVGTPPANTPADWRTTLPEEIRADPSLKDLADVPALAKSFINAQKLIGTDKIPKPRDDWTEDQWRQFYQGIGAPDKPEGYELPKDLKLPDGLAVVPEELDAWRKEFMAAGLTKKQANRILANYFARAGTEFTKAATDRTAATTQAELALKQEFGDQYDANLDIARAALKKFGSESLANQMVSTGLGSHPDMVRLLLKIGKMTMEDSAHGAGENLIVGNATQAQSEINNLKTDAKFQGMLQNRMDPGHKAAVQRWLSLHQAAAPKQREDL